MDKMITMNCWDNGCYISGEWLRSNLRGHQELDTIYSSREGDRLWFQPDLIQAGWYKISVYQLKVNGKQHYEIYHHGRMSEASSEATNGYEGWAELGEFYFTSDGTECVVFVVRNECVRGTSIKMQPIDNSSKQNHNGNKIANYSQEGVLVRNYFDIPGIILDESSATYREEGDWRQADLGNYKKEHQARVAMKTAAIASWSVTAPNLKAQEQVNFIVYCWMPYGNEIGTKVRYTIHTMNGVWMVELRQEKHARGGWVKLAIVQATGDTVITIRMQTLEEGPAYAASIKLVSTAAGADAPMNMLGGADTQTVAILVNQAGYDTGRAKRATVVNTSDGTLFFVKEELSQKIAFTGQVVNQIADFSKLNPEQLTKYVIEANGATSYSFTIANSWLQRVSVPPAVAFMNHARNDAWLPGLTSIAWRDSHQFSFELGSMVWMYMSNPSLYEAMPRQIYQLERTMFAALRTQNEPDLIWLMKFGAERYYDYKVNQGRALHPLIKEQLAFYVYLYPFIKQYVSEAEYIKLRDFIIKEWELDHSQDMLKWYDISGEKYNLFEIQTSVGDIKGSYPPGHSIVPNLLMYEVVKRDQLGGEAVYMQAAYRNCEYLLEHFDIASPRYSKGQRMSEHITMEGLAYFAECYPEAAPEKLQPSISRWAEIMITRSNNLWDLRMASAVAAGDEANYWTGAAYAKSVDPKLTALMNEPGSEAGIQAAMFAAARVIDDQEVVIRLKEIGVAGIDHMFGRNPYGRMFFYDAKRDIKGAHAGWFSKHEVAGNGRLGEVPGRIDASPKEAAYPFNPQADPGYVEGWVAFNTAWNNSIAYSAGEMIAITVDTQKARCGERVAVRLKAPLAIDDLRVLYAKIQVNIVAASGNSKEEEMTLSEEGADRSYFSGSYIVPKGISRIEFSYGFGLFRKAAILHIVDN